MLIKLLYFALLGLLLAYPLGRVVRWLLQRSGHWTLRPVYVRPYVPFWQRGAGPTDVGPPT